MMRSIREAWGVAWLQWRDTLRDWRTAAVLLLLLTGELQYTQPLFEYARRVSFPSAPWLLPLFLSNANMRLIIGGCAVLLLCNLFRSRQENISLLARCGKRNLIAGKVLYLLMITLAYTLLTGFFFVFFHMDQIYMTAEWGPLLGSWGRYYGQSGMSNPVTRVTEHFSAMRAMYLSGMILWITLIDMGLVVLILSLYGYRVAAILSLGVLLALDYLAIGAPGLGILEQYGAAIAWFSPMTWSNLSMVTPRGGISIYAYPPLSYVCVLSLGLLAVLLAVLTVVVNRSIRSGEKRRELHWTA